MKNIKFDGDSLVVTEAGGLDINGNQTESVWTVAPEQVSRHVPVFSADMTAAQRTKADAVAAKFAPQVVPAK